MTGSEIRTRFLEHFRRRDHTVLPSAPLVLPDDPTTLFTIAGMQPLKPYYQGLAEPPAPRLASCQKCFRTADLDEIGRTDRHNTFMEMLGNFAPTGGYFKETAIPLAWELTTEGFGLPPERLRVTIHPDDEQAHRVWTEEVGLPADRVHRNASAWWAPGATGPCGPCSELFYDRGREYGCGQLECYPEHCDRYLEFWNLVFMQFDAQADGSLTDLPRPGIDTGMGLERITSILQGVDSNFDTDLLRPLVDFVRDSSTTHVVASERKIADHLRAMTFLIGDGVVPSNEGRGYVLRRLIRRAALHARRIGMRERLESGVDRVVAVMGDHYTELAERAPLIRSTIAVEADRFNRTLEQGMEQFDAIVARGGGEIRGDDAFRLHDTFGFPLELTRELAGERGLRVDEEGFRAAMQAQRERSRTMVAKRWLEGVSLPGTRFVGYQRLDSQTSLERIYREGAEVDRVDEGDDVEVYLHETPFYAESGGQVGDTGIIEGPHGRIRVWDTRRPSQGVTAHLGVVEQGYLVLAEAVTARVDSGRRRQIARHHSATHLLHKALRERFGESTVQRGSLVAPDHTTFDFAHDRPVTADEIRHLTRRMSEQVRAALPFQEESKSYKEAVASGAMHLFDEKYGDVVRVVCFGDWTCELCGGTHVENTADIGPVLIVSESGVSAGTRRIDMVAGTAAEAVIERRLGDLSELSRTLGSTVEEVPDRVGDLRGQLRERERQIAKLQEDLVLARLKGGGGAAAEPTRVPLRLEKVGDGVNLDLKVYADRMLESLHAPGVVAVTDGSRYVIKVSDELTGELDATRLREDFGSGGGTARLAQGKLAVAPEQAFERLRTRLA